MKWVLPLPLTIALACGFGPPSPVERGPQVTVVTLFSGMSSEDIDSTIAVPMHAALASVPDVVTIDSVATDGQAEVTVTFATGTQMYAVRGDIGEALMHLSLPDSAETPMLMPWWDERIEVVVDIPRAQSLRDALMEMPGVNDVRLRGIPQRQAVAEVPPATLAALGLSASDLLDGTHLEDVATITVSEYADVDVISGGQPVAVAEILTTGALFRPTFEEELDRFDVKRILAPIRLDMDCPDRQTCTTLATSKASELGASVTEVTDHTAHVWTTELQAARTALESTPTAHSTLRTIHDARLVLSSASNAPITESELTQIRESILPLPGVVSIQSRHLARPDLDVEVDPARLAMLGLHMRDVTRTIRLEDGVPIGHNGDTVLIRWEQTPLQDLPISLPTGGTVSLADVATITMTSRSAPVYRRDGRRAHVVDVYLENEEVRLDPTTLVLPQGWTAEQQ